MARREWKTSRAVGLAPGSVQLEVQCGIRVEQWEEHLRWMMVTSRLPGTVEGSGGSRRVCFQFSAGRGSGAVAAEKWFGGGGTVTGREAASTIHGRGLDRVFFRKRHGVLGEERNWHYSTTTVNREINLNEHQHCSMFRKES